MIYSALKDDKSSLGMSAKQIKRYIAANYDVPKDYEKSVDLELKKMCKKGDVTKKETISMKHTKGQETKALPNLKITCQPIKNDTLTAKAALDKVAKKYDQGRLKFRMNNFLNKDEQENFLRAKEVGAHSAGIQLERPSTEARSTNQKQVLSGSSKMSPWSKRDDVSTVEAAPCSSSIKPVSSQNFSDSKPVTARNLSTTTTPTATKNLLSSRKLRPKVTKKRKLGVTRNLRAQSRSSPSKLTSKKLAKVTKAAALGKLAKKYDKGRLKLRMNNFLNKDEQENCLREKEVGAHSAGVQLESTEARSTNKKQALSSSSKMSPSSKRDGVSTVGAAPCDLRIKPVSSQNFSDLIKPVTTQNLSTTTKPTAPENLLSSRKLRPKVTKKRKQGVTRNLRAKSRSVPSKLNHKKPAKITKAQASHALKAK